MRTFDRIYGPLYKHTMLCEELHKPYFKSHYAGKPTKRYIRINRELYKASQVSVAYYKMGLVGLL